MSGTNNFLQHNPTEANQETDAAYLADSLRTGGIGTDATLPSPWLNKVWYQCTTFVAAFAQMMANKNYNMQDGDITALTNTLANVLTNADSKLSLKGITFSTTPVFDASQANGFELDLAGNVTSSTLINVSIGQILTFVIKQGATPYSFVAPTNLNNWIPIPLSANSFYIQQYIVTEDGSIRPYNSFSFGIQSGTNSLGFWVKLPNGLIIQVGRVTGITNAGVHGSVAGQAAVAFDSASYFTSTPFVFATPQAYPANVDGATVYASLAYGYGISTTGFQLVLNNPQNIGGSGANTLPTVVAWFAIGF
jgi:hypothetical protein